jgi:cold-inducible RNA-binding protein
MSKKLFVGGLAWATDDASLADVFGRFGELVEAKVITDRDTGRSRGFGFVTYADDDSAQKALEAMNGQQLDGRTLRVDMASEQGPRRTGGGGGGGGGDRRGGGGRDRDRW